MSPYVPGRRWAHNGHVPNVDWDGWLEGLIKDQAARVAADVRAYLIDEVSRAISNSDALRAGDADRLAEVAVDTMIECTHENRIQPS
jgi:hypothetical protein